MWRHKRRRAGPEERAAVKCGCSDTSGFPCWCCSIVPRFAKQDVEAEQLVWTLSTEHCIFWFQCVSAPLKLSLYMCGTLCIVHQTASVNGCLTEQGTHHSPCHCSSNQDTEVVVTHCQNNPEAMCSGTQEDECHDPSLWDYLLSSAYFMHLYTTSHQVPVL